jgi:hypothetical protein
MLKKQVSNRRRKHSREFQFLTILSPVAVAKLIIISILNGFHCTQMANKLADNQEQAAD